MQKTLLILIYFSIFSFIYGFYILNPFYTDWCINVMQPPALDIPACYFAYPDMLRDVSTNFIEYLGFINSKIFLPYSDMTAFPKTSGVLYIDCVPLLAIWVKAVVLCFSKFFEVPFVKFQYIGIVGATNFIIQGLLAFLIIKKITKTNHVNALLGSLFFVIAPITLERFPVHFALSSQWIILASFLPFLFHKEWNKKIILLYCLVLGVLSLGIHPYFILTNAFIMIAFSFYLYFKDGEKTLSYCVFTVYILGALIDYFITGGLSSGVLADTEKFWFNLYAFNLNSFFNPSISENFFFSTVFPFLNGRFPVRDVCNWEGFSYLGAGVLIPLVAILAYCLYNLPKKSFREKHRGFFEKYDVEIKVFSIFFVLTMLYSCSLEIAFNQHLLLKINVPDFWNKCLSVFRAPARVIWADFFIVYFFVLCFLLKKFKPLVATCIIGVLFMIQAVDMSVFFKTYRYFFAKKVVYESPLKNEGWNLLKQDKKHIFTENFDKIDIYHFRDVHYWGVKNGFKLSSVMASRRYANREKIMISNLVNPQNEDLFIFFPSQKNYFEKYLSTLTTCYLLDGYLVCTKGDYPTLYKYKVDIKNYPK